MTNACIITIGDELLIGQVIDTNSAWIAQQLNKIGIRVKRRVAVGDHWDEIWNALDEAYSQADIILITGGLGPTADDITKPLLCKYFDGQLVVHTETLNHVTYLFEKVFKRALTERNKKQAEVPNNCRVLMNQSGTAPGMWFEKQGKVFISMPGVPNEMKNIMTDFVLPQLSQQFDLAYITHRTLVTFGIGESMLADMMEDFEKALPSYISLAYLPNYGMVRLRLTATGKQSTDIDQAINQYFKTLQTLTGPYLIANEDATMEKIVFNQLKSQNKTLSTAESCTGGYIAHLITSFAGSSAIYKGSIIAYANELKENLLMVEQETLYQDGAVSEETVIQMAKGTLHQIRTDYTIAVSGIMGPDGGTPEKPVGTVWVAVGNYQQIKTKLFHFRFDRTKNIQLTAMNALNLLREFMAERSI